jgi:hypothetical protein
MDRGMNVEKDNERKKLSKKERKKDTSTNTKTIVLKAPKFIWK